MDQLQSRTHSHKSLITILGFFRNYWLPIVVPFIVYRIFKYFQFARLRRNYLKNKTVLITGASSGLGEALAHLFHRNGCKVILAARRVEELQRVKSQLLEQGKKVTVVTHEPSILPLDLADLTSLPSKARQAWEIASQDGGVDILVNNGGVSVRGTCLETSLDVDISIMTVNYFGHVALTKALVAMMIERGGGHVVTISSLQGKMGLPLRSAYGASKHACQAFFDSLRCEVADKNVKVCTVCPGYIRTNLSLNAVTATGSTHGEMDDATAKGMAAEVVAERILDALVRDEKEVLVASSIHILAVYLRTNLPGIFFKIMNRRATKELSNREKED